MDKQCFYRISVKGIVVDEQGRILLSREATGKWEMLGGGLDYNEDPIEGLRREIREEAGLEITYVSASPKYFITNLSKRDDSAIYMANIIYEISLQDLNFIASDECQELKFFSVEDMEKADLYPNVQKLLEILKKL